MTDTCTACFKAIEGKPIECDYCHSQDEKWCSSICQSSVGWYQHEPHCNVLHVNGLIATPYAWQNMTSNWQEQKHAFPAYLLREKVSPIQSRQTVVPAVTQRSEVPEAKESKTKPHPFQLKINGELLGSFSAPDNMISEYSANAAARELASSRNTQLHEGRTYWVGDKDMSKNVTILPGKVNEFQLVRGQSGDEHTVRVHVFEDSLKHFTEQVGDRLGHGLKRHLKSQYKNKGINDKASATFFGINADTKDAVTFTVDKEMQLLDLEFYTPKTPSAIKLQQQTFDHSFDDRNETDIQALIMASQDLPEAQPHLDTLVEYHRNLTTKNPEMIAEDVQMLIRARASINAVVDVLKQHQELIGPLYGKELETKIVNSINSGNHSYFKNKFRNWYTQLKKLHDSWEEYEMEFDQSDNLGLKREGAKTKVSFGFKKAKARAKARTTKLQMDSIRNQIRKFQTSLQRASSKIEGKYNATMTQYMNITKLLLQDNYEVAKTNIDLLLPLDAMTPSPTGQRIGFEIPSAQPIGVWLTFEDVPDYAVWHELTNKKLITNKPDIDTKDPGVKNRVRLKKDLDTATLYPVTSHKTKNGGIYWKVNNDPSISLADVSYNKLHKAAVNAQNGGSGAPGKNKEESESGGEADALASNMAFLEKISKTGYKVKEDTVISQTVADENFKVFFIKVILYNRQLSLFENANTDAKINDIIEKLKEVKDDIQNSPDAEPYITYRKSFVNAIENAIKDLARKKPPVSMEERKQEKVVVSKRKSAKEPKQNLEFNPYVVPKEIAEKFEQDKLEIVQELRDKLSGYKNVKLTESVQNVEKIVIGGSSIWQALTWGGPAKKIKDICTDLYNDSNTRKYFDEFFRYVKWIFYACSSYHLEGDLETGADAYFEKGDITGEYEIVEDDVPTRKYKPSKQKPASSSTTSTSSPSTFSMPSAPRDDDGIHYDPGFPGGPRTYYIQNLFPSYIAEHPSFDAYHTPASLSNDPEEVRRLRAEEPQLVSSKSSKYWDKYHDTDYTDF